MASVIGKHPDAARPVDHAIKLACEPDISGRVFPRYHNLIRHIGFRAGMVRMDLPTRHNHRYFFTQQGAGEATRTLRILAKCKVYPAYYHTDRCPIRQPDFTGIGSSHLTIPLSDRRIHARAESGYQYGRRSIISDPSDKRRSRNIRWVDQTKLFAIGAALFL